MKKLTTLTLLTLIATISFGNSKMIDMTEYYGGKEAYIVINTDEITKMVTDKGKTAEKDRCIITFKNYANTISDPRMTLEGLSCQQFVEKHKIQVD